MESKQTIYLAKYRLATILVSIIGAVIILATPYKMDVYETCAIQLYFLPATLLPILALSLVLIIVSSFFMFKKSNISFEILMIVSSIVGIPGIIASDYGQFLALLCGDIVKTIYLPAFYLAFGYLAFNAVWGAFLLTKKKALLATK